MTHCLFASDVHGQVDRYDRLFQSIENIRPDAVFLGGDLLPSPFLALSSGLPQGEDFVNGYLARNFELLRERLRSAYPDVFLILGNDDGKFEEAAFLDVASRGLWTYVHDRRVKLGDYRIYGYAYVPPTPFNLKDWERYDVSRFVDPGCVSPEDGSRSVPEPVHHTRYATIAADLEELAGSDDLQRAVFLFHSPPYQSKLDRAALDGKSIDYAPLDVHVGSIAIQRFVTKRQPLLTLHGHVHESARITGSWRDRIGRTHMFGAAHDGPELALVSFDLEDLQSASRDLL